LTLTAKKPNHLLCRYITYEACIVVNKNGEIITGWLEDEFGNTIKQILKEAK